MITAKKLEIIIMNCNLQGLAVILLNEQIKLTFFLSLCLFLKLSKYIYQYSVQYMYTLLEAHDRRDLS